MSKVSVEGKNMTGKVESSTGRVLYYADSIIMAFYKDLVANDEEHVKEYLRLLIEQFETRK